jgi:UPF0716 family protein affecting phage T7 exclusion
VSTFFASMLGGFLTFIEIVLSAIIGMSILKTFEYSLNENIINLTQGKITQDEFMAKNMNKALGAILLIIPGFFTDILGVFLLLGLFTFILGKIFTFSPKNNNTQNSYNYTYSNYSQTTQKRRNNDEDIIDVEIIDSYDSIKH